MQTGYVESQARPPDMWPRKPGASMVFTMGHKGTPCLWIFERLRKASSQYFKTQNGPNGK
jgi:hypothetical protein